MFLRTILVLSALLFWAEARPQNYDDRDYYQDDRDYYYQDDRDYYQPPLAPEPAYSSPAESSPALAYVDKVCRPNEVYDPETDECVRKVQASKPRPFDLSVFG